MFIYKGDISPVHKLMINTVNILFSILPGMQRLKFFQQSITHNAVKFHNMPLDANFLGYS